MHVYVCGHGYTYTLVKMHAHKYITAGYWLRFVHASNCYNFKSDLVLKVCLKLKFSFSLLQFLHHFSVVFLQCAMKALKCRTFGAKIATQLHALLISEQTDSHMLCCFAGGVSTLSLELSEAEQLCINYGSQRAADNAQARKHDARLNNAHARFPRSPTALRAVQCRKWWISATERFQRKPHDCFDLRYPLHRFQDEQMLER